MKQRVLLGMSGGVDSSVSAVLLLEQGYEVIGGFMKNWSEESVERVERSQGLSELSDGNSDAQLAQGVIADCSSGNPRSLAQSECSWRTERRDAMRVAAQLGIPFHTFDFEADYRSKVYEYMIDEYKAGRTPNPDVLCNKYMKFDLFLKEADTLGCDFIATGHYARRMVDESGTAHLLAGIDTNKDQTYFLCQLNQEQLKRSLFPIGDLEKKEVREIARKHNLSVAEKKDSQGICFVGKVDMQQFLEARITPHDGNIVTTDGKVLGQHRGFEFYTIGQRGGLGIGGGVPLYVVDRRPDTNEVVVAVGADDPALFRSSLIATNLVETIPGNFKNFIGKPISARIRYRQPLADCVVEPRASEPSVVAPTPYEGGGWGEVHVRFSHPQRAVAPGQFIAFYVGDELIGSGVIQE